MNILVLKKSFLTTLLLTLILFLGSCSGKRVQTVKEETEANKIIDVLRSYGIHADKYEIGEGEKKVFEIEVSGGEEEYGAAIQLMEDHCLPQRIPQEVETSGLVSSIEIEQAQQLRRTKINIESQLRNMPGTTCVDLTIVPPEKSSLSLNPYKASASVVVKYKTEEFGLNVDQIARMVAGGVQGLSADNVTVTLTRQPLRKLPDFDRGRNIRRIIYVSIIGLATILLFVGIVFYLRKRKGDAKGQPTEELDADDENELIEEGEMVDEPNLIENEATDEEETIG